MTAPALVIVQARMGSSRFPGKSLAEIDGKPILWYLFRQLSYCRSGIRSILATTDRPVDDPLADYAEKQGWDIFRGSETDVLGRYRDAAAAFDATDDTVIVRVTGDDIWPDPNLVDAAVNLHTAFAGLIDCVFTTGEDDLPYGVYIDSYNFRALNRAAAEATDTYDREHVSPYMRRDPVAFPRLEIGANPPIQGPPLSIDTLADLDFNDRLQGEMRVLEKPPYRLAQIQKAFDRVKRQDMGR